MSKHNKANKNNYTQRGRLTPDEMARERMKQARPEAGRADDRVKGGPSPDSGKNAGEQVSSRDRNEPEE
jgi:hypothetical protein